MRTFLSLAVVAIVAAIIVVATSNDLTPPAATPIPGEKLAASAVLNIDPTRSTSTLPARASGIVLSPFVQAFVERKDWVALYKRIKDAPATPETQYLQAELLSACAKRSSTQTAVSPSMPARKNDTPEERRARFIASLAPNDPQLEKRKAAYDQAYADRCGELAQIEYNSADVQKLYDAAAAAGDARAKTALLARQIAEEAQANSRKSMEGKATGVTGYQVSDAQFATMRELLASRDPLVIADLSGILSSTLNEASIRVGPNQEAIDHQAFHQAWGLVGCEFGAPCGKDSPPMLFACANSGRCDTNNLYDYTYFYGASPHAAQLVERYRDWLTQMVSTGNLSQLTLVRGPNNPSSTFTFSGRR
jgi:hypothetical protein